MSSLFEANIPQNNPENIPTFANRYEAINKANQESFYMTNPRRTLDVYQSVHSFGEPRSETSLAAQRVIAGGNMSPLGAYGPAEITEEERKIDAQENMDALFESLAIPKTSVYSLNPERDYSTPLTLVNIDAQETNDATEWPKRLDTSGDFIYTRDPNKVLAVRPADCPVMIATGNTPEGKIYTMVHYAWKGAAHGYVAQTAEAFKMLGVDKGSLEIYISAGGHAESYPYTNYPQNPLEQYPGTEGLFTNVTSRINEDGTEVWDFAIDTPKFVYDQVLSQLEVNPTQVFSDTSDTSALESGYSSHSRSARLEERGNRDLVVAKFAVQ